jgi:hypothetical protein
MSAMTGCSGTVRASSPLGSTGTVANAAGSVGLNRSIARRCKSMAFPMSAVAASSPSVDLAFCIST